MRRSGVASGEDAMICVIAGFFVTFTAGFSLPVGENGIAALKNFGVASTQSAGKRPKVSINANPEHNSSLTPSLRICCPVGWGFLDKEECEQIDHLNDSTTLEFPTQHDPLSLQSLPERLTIEDFHIFAVKPCSGHRTSTLPQIMFFSGYLKFLSNGSVFMTPFGMLLDYQNYCFAAFAHHNIYKIMFCFDNKTEGHNDEHYPSKDGVNIAVPAAKIVSVPFLVLTFLIYSLLPELRNMHGYTLRGYVSSLVLFYTMSTYLKLKPLENISGNIRVLIAFIFYFMFSSIFFWLNVICFDMWWTLRGFGPNQSIMKQREIKKFIMYSIYAWGLASLSSGLYTIGKSVPSIFGSSRQQNSIAGRWIEYETAKDVFIFSPILITLICNTCLFISTSITICQHKKDMTTHLTGTDSQRYNDHKQWFILYVKLFVVMGMSWPIGLIAAFFASSPPYVMYITSFTISFQGVFIFIIFVWKDKTKKLLLKRLGWQNCISNRGIQREGANHSSTLKTVTKIVNIAPLEEENDPCTERNKTTIDEGDCV